jgi:hypothetical protein
MAVVFGECGRKCFTGPGNTVCIGKIGANRLGAFGWEGGGEGGGGRAKVNFESFKALS